MKSKAIFLVSVFFLLTSCAVHNGMTYNTNNNNTQVVLTEKNFRVISSVKGDSRSLYVLGIGGLSKSALIADARKKMIQNSDFIGSSKAIINESVEIRSAFYLLVWVKKVTVSANIIEFFDKTEIKVEKNQNDRYNNKTTR